MAVSKTDTYTLLEPLSNGSTTNYDVYGEGLSTYLGDITKYLFMLIALVSAFYLIYGGIQYLTTDMSSLKLQGKETIKRVIVGLVFIFSIWTVFNAVNPELLRSSLGFKASAGSAVVSVDAAIGDYSWPTGNVVGDGVTCNGGSRNRSISNVACADPYRAFVEKYSAQYGVDKNIIRATIWQESSGNANIGTSRSGAVGLMQIVPATARSIGCLSGWETDADKNIDCGTRYLKQGQSRGYGAYDLYAGYNGGYGSEAMSASSDCVGLKKWQCSFDNTAHTVCNLGFLESRNYAVEGAVWQKAFDDGKMCSW